MTLRTMKIIIIALIILNFVTLAYVRTVKNDLVNAVTEIERYVAKVELVSYGCQAPPMGNIQ